MTRSTAPRLTGSDSRKSQKKPQAPRPVEAARRASLPSLAEQAYRILEEQIVTLALKPGSELSEFDLVNRFKLGRTPVREALQRLAREGLIIVRPRQGLTVSQIDVERQLKLIVVRREIERVMARSAAEHASPAERAQFAKLVEQFDLAGTKNDDLAFMRADQLFNQLLAQTCGNEFAVNSIRLMTGLSRRFWSHYQKDAADLPSATRLHAAIAGAVAAGDAAGAVSATDQLMDYIERFTRAAAQS